MMHILMISSGTNTRLFEKGSADATRLAEYGELAGRLDIIVFTPEGFEEKYIADNVRLIPTNSKSRWHYVSDAVARGVRIDGVDLVTTQDPFEAGLAGLRIVERTGAKLHVQIHTDFLSRYFRKSHWLNWVRVYIAGKVLPQADGIRAVSKRIADSLAEHGYVLKRKPAVLPIFVDVESIKKRTPALDIHEVYLGHSIIVLMVSRLSKEKNIDQAIDVFGEIRKAHPQAGLVIVGDGPERASLEERAKQYVGSIYFAGWQKDVISYFKTADVYLLTSLYEGYGMTLMQAVASGCPVVTTDVGMVGSVLTKDHVLVCPVDDMHCLARKLEMMLGSKRMRAECAQSALRITESMDVYSKETFLRRMRHGWLETLRS